MVYMWLCLQACHVGLFINMGQCCCASSRILVDENVHDEFVAKVIELAKGLRQVIYPEVLPTGHVSTQIPVTTVLI